MLYNNKQQEKLFHLHQPQKATNEDCYPINGIFTSFECDKSYVLAQSTPEFNCIGWAIGVKKFIDPTVEINQYYSKKVQ